MTRPSGPVDHNAVAAENTELLVHDFADMAVHRVSQPLQYLYSSFFPEKLEQQRGCWAVAVVLPREVVVGPCIPGALQRNFSDAQVPSVAAGIFGIVAEVDAKAEQPFGTWLYFLRPTKSVPWYISIACPLCYILRSRGPITHIDKTRAGPYNTQNGKRDMQTHRRPKAYP